MPNRKLFIRSIVVSGVTRNCFKGEKEMKHSLIITVVLIRNQQDYSNNNRNSYTRIGFIT